MEHKQVERAVDESLEEIIKTLKNMIAQTEDKIRRIAEGKTAKI